MAKKKEDNPLIGGSINAGTMNNLEQNAKDLVSNPEALKTYRENEAKKKDQTIKELEAKDATLTDNIVPTEDEIAERQKIADGIAQEKAQSEAAQPPVSPTTSSTSGTPSASVNVQANGAGNSTAFGKSYSARRSGSTGYDVVNLENESQTETNQDTTSKQTTVGNQETESTNESQGTTAQTQETAFDPNKAAENVAALDPFLAKVDKEGAAKAFLDVYGAKPTPDALNNAAELARKKNKIAVLSESLRVLFDMGAAAGGGNVYKRDQVQKNIAETKAELNKEEAKYQDAVEKFNQGLLGAKGADLGTKRALMNDAIKAGYSTVSEGKNTQTATGTSKTASNQTTDGTSNTKGTQTTKAQHEQVVNNKEYDNAVAASMAAAGRGEKNTQIITTVVDPTTGQTREQLYTQFNPTEWAAVKPRARMFLASNPKVIRDAATRYGISEETVKKVLAGKYSEKEVLGTKDGTISYEDLSDDLVRNFSMQDPRAKEVLDYRRTSQGIDKDNTRTGVVSGTTMDFTDNQQPIDNSGVNTPLRPNSGNPNELLDSLSTQ